MQGNDPASLAGYIQTAVNSLEPDKLEGLELKGFVFLGLGLCRRAGSCRRCYLLVCAWRCCNGGARLAQPSNPQLVSVVAWSNCASSQPLSTSESKRTVCDGTLTCLRESFPRSVVKMMRATRAVAASFSHGLPTCACAVLPLLCVFSRLTCKRARQRVVTSGGATKTKMQTAAPDPKWK